MSDNSLISVGVTPIFIGSIPNVLPDTVFGSNRFGAILFPIADVGCCEAVFEGCEVFILATETLVTLQPFS